MHAASGQKEGAHWSIRRHCRGEKQPPPTCWHKPPTRRSAI